jgi:hypothetical protein
VEGDDGAHEKVSGANLLSMETWKPTDGPLDVK